MLWGRGVLVVGVVEVIFVDYEGVQALVLEGYPAEDALEQAGEGGFSAG